MKTTVKRTERGWAGHFILSERCLFRRNTLLERGSTRIVVSTVGGLVDYHVKGFPNTIKIIPVSKANNRYYETIACHAELVRNTYWDADVCELVPFTSPWYLTELSTDDQANNMHEAVVDEIFSELELGIKYEKKGGAK